MSLHRLGVCVAKLNEKVAAIVEQIGSQASPMERVETALTKLKRAIAQTVALNERLSKIEARIENEKREALVESVARWQAGGLS
jgi:hypothetical protein